MKIVAFYAPYPGAGKSLAARWVARRCRLFNIAFATPLRNAVYDIISYPVFHMVYPAFPPGQKEVVIPHLGVSWRDVMVAFGAAGRALRPDFWVRIMERRFQMQPYDYVIDDLRFQEEYDFLRTAGARIIRIENPGREIVTTATEGRLEGNAFDAVIVNTKENPRAYLRAVEATVRGLFHET